MLELSRFWPEHYTSIAVITGTVPVNILYLCCCLSKYSCIVQVTAPWIFSSSSGYRPPQAASRLQAIAQLSVFSDFGFQISPWRSKPDLISRSQFGSSVFSLSSRFRFRFRSRSRSDFGQDFCSSDFGPNLPQLDFQIFDFQISIAMPSSFSSTLAASMAVTLIAVISWPLLSSPARTITSQSGFHSSQVTSQRIYTDQIVLRPSSTLFATSSMVFPPQFYSSSSVVSLIPISPNRNPSPPTLPSPVDSLGHMDAPTPTMSTSGPPTASASPPVGPPPSPSPLVSTACPVLALPIPFLVSVHPIQTRLKSNISKPRTILSLNTTSPILEPSSYSKASKDLACRQTMTDEFNVLMDNHTWTLVPHPITKNAIGCRLVYKIKYNSNGSVERYKDRLVALTNHQREGLDFQETFCPVVKPTTIRLVLSLVVSFQWVVR
ncbi:Retrovirus-related Pol polyprotein from transposon RE2-like protein [Drosera capensis]